MAYPIAERPMDVIIVALAPVNDLGMYAVRQGRLNIV